MPYPPPGFLDAASGQPLNPAAREALLTAIDSGWADPQRLYREGRRASMLQEAARESIAARIGAQTNEVHFTGSGIQALATGVWGALDAQPRGSRSPLVVSAVEHSATLAAGDAYADNGGAVRVIGVDRLARIDLDDYVSAIPGAALACLQVGNHEVGTLQPVDAISAACEESGVPLLVDGTVSVGRVDVPSQWSLLAANAPSWGGPAGVGILAVRRPVRWRPPEAGLGLANVPLAVAAARGLEWADEHRHEDAVRARSLTDRILADISRDIADVALLGDPRHRLPHLAAFSCLYVDGEALVLGLDAAGYAISSGSSCVADTRRPSHVLTAMGALTQGNVRVSLPFDVTDDTVTGFLDTLPRIVGEVRAFLGAADSEESR